MTISNYLGGIYYFTADEAKIDQNQILLVEGKHSNNSFLPSLDDIKDGLLKMVLFTNLEDVMVQNHEYTPYPMLKLTSSIKFDERTLNDSQKRIIEILKTESKENNFRITFP